MPTAHTNTNNNNNSTNTSTNTSNKPTAHIPTSPLLARKSSTKKPRQPHPHRPRTGKLGSDPQDLCNQWPRKSCLNPAAIEESV
ncbi:hypothetical protein NA56DRAFT_642969 [Hyaloscypha hepaticicola]|uniref:Uncharacterized protein n=1 Tax=Hyaloscypha hepaticicola TaxID=2082293 RepID=A0A2J6QG14_9HELO|nr:hypothetical protein NA56DRAFT_642969 [Hyaloscypha hepaticicola]